MNLVIVESPTKARTIGRYLGNGYTIKASMGHVMDLPKSTLGVDVEHNFDPQFEVIKDKQKIISELKQAAKSADAIILATDPDREGEAIASHVAEILGYKDTRILGEKNKKNHVISQYPNIPISSKFKRMVFHEITKEAVENALKNPRGIDKNLVDAQTARRVLDRLVGYKLSPLLWQKVRRGLSAGRVQSVALRLIVEREREIEKFKKEEYYTVTATLKKETEETKGTEGTEFELIEINGQKIESQEVFNLYDGEYKITKTSIKTADEAKNLEDDLKTKQFIVADVLQKEMRRSPLPPFTTSTLQQEASRRFGFAGRRTMSLAQKLYEEGYITYHRTDSVIVSTLAIGAMRNLIIKDYGAKYLPEKPRFYTTKQKLAQEAHEAIRPTRMHSSVEIQHDFGRDYQKIYDLIWRRAIASQMADAITESTTVYVDSQVKSSKLKVQSDEKENAYRLKANGSVLIFEGFLKVNPQALQDQKLPQFIKSDSLNLLNALAEKHETPPPPRYNEASLIKTLEEKGIGRPSTYATIVSTIESRSYVERLEGRFAPTTVGIAVNDFLVSYFSDIDDIPFTAEMEDELDNIAHGKKEWKPMIRQFYTPFEEKLEKVKEDAKRVKIEVEETGEMCPNCGSKLVIRVGRFGKFVSCSTFPTCKFSKPLVEETNLFCPKCGGLPATPRKLGLHGGRGKIVIKKTRRGRKFYGCSNYPACDFASWQLQNIEQPISPTLPHSKSV